MNENQCERTRKRMEGVINFLPSAVRRELLFIAEARRDFYTSTSEIRIRRMKESSITVSGEMVRLTSTVGADEFSSLFDAVTDGARFSHKRTLSEGYIPLADGVRLGVSGDFAGGELYAPTSLVFRIPCSGCEVSEELYSAWESRAGGMLIFSGVGGGKTSALRALADMISRRSARRVVAIDERYEFLSEDCPAVDLLRGYEKAKGIEIAKRVLSADVILVDEIGSEEEARAVLSVGRGGTSVIATAHAESVDEILTSRALKEMVRSDFFSVFAQLRCEGGARSVNLHRREDLPITV